MAGIISLGVVLSVMLAVHCHSLPVVEGELTLFFKQVSATSCVSNCTGLKDGDYESCLGCHVYATCSNGVLYDNRPCPAGLVWNDVKKKCDYDSDNTCHDNKPGRCVKSCKGVRDGDYQSCKGCHVYVTCSNGFIFDKRPCPADLVWDDNVKRCDHTSTTCPSSDSDVEY